MYVNKLDKQISILLENQEGPEQDFQNFRALLEDLCEELKQVWHKESFTDSLVKSLIEDCLYYAARPLEDEESGDETKIEQLLTLYNVASQTREFKNAVSWAERSKDAAVRILYKKVRFRETYDLSQRELRTSGWSDLPPINLA